MELEFGKAIEEIVERKKQSLEQEMKKTIDFELRITELFLLTLGLTDLTEIKQFKDQIHSLQKGYFEQKKEMKVLANDLERLNYLSDQNKSNSPKMNSIIMGLGKLFTGMIPTNLYWLIINYNASLDTDSP